MKLLFDQILSWRLPNKLADLYPDSQHIREAGMKESEDVDIWNYAKANGFVIVSKDLDFQQRSLLFGHPPKVVRLCRKLHGSNNRRFIATVFGSYSRIRARRGKVVFSVAVVNETTRPKSYWI